MKNNIKNIFIAFILLPYLCGYGCSDYYKVKIYGKIIRDNPAKINQNKFDDLVRIACNAPPKSSHLNYFFLAEFPRA